MSENTEKVQKYNKAFVKAFKKQRKNKLSKKTEKLKLKKNKYKF